jgi:hypothetical protein
MAGTRSKRTNENKSIQEQPGHTNRPLPGDPAKLQPVNHCFDGLQWQEPEANQTRINRPLPVVILWDPAKLQPVNRCFDGLQLVQLDATGATRPG